MLENGFHSLSGRLLLENNLIQANDAIFHWTKKYMEINLYFKFKDNAYFVTAVACFIVNLQGQLFTVKLFVIEELRFFMKRM